VEAEGVVADPARRPPGRVDVPAEAAAAAQGTQWGQAADGEGGAGASRFFRSAGAACGPFSLPLLLMPILPVLAAITAAVVVEHWRRR
jgi:hypothetical protein